MQRKERLSTYIVELVGVEPDAAPMRAVIETEFVPASVTFYDKRYFDTEHGQHISRYHLDTLLDHPRDMGLDLDGGVPAWTVPGAQFAILFDVMTRAATGTDSRWANAFTK